MTRVPIGVRVVPALVYFLVFLASMLSLPAPARAEIPGPKYRIGEVRFENDGEWFLLAIPTGATWAHWTLANPPRIIIDLADAISELPNAPGLYEVPMERGPVRVFRTSQFSNTPLDRRVRITLELSAITPYEARRVGEEVHILVESPGTKAPPARLTAGGMTVGGEPVPDSPAHHGQADANVKETPVPAKLAVREPAPLARAGHEDPGAVDDTGAKGGKAPDHASVEESPKETGAEAPSHRDTHSDSRDVDPAPEPNGRSTRGREDLAVSDPAPLYAPPTSEAAENPVEGEAEADVHAEVTSAEDPGAKPPEDPYARDLAEKRKIGDGDIEKMKSTLEELLGKQNVDKVTETGRGEILTEDELRQRIREEEFAEEEWEDWKDFDESAEIESPDSLRTSRAADLLRAAVQDWLAGDYAGAEKRADRCVRYYGEYPGGMQAALLLRETYWMTGREALATSLRGVPELPDTSFFDARFFQRLLATYFDVGDDERLLDRMQYWGPLYPEGGWYARYHYLLGREAYNAGNADLAEEHLGRLSLHDEGGDAAYLMRARLADEAGRLVDALVLYRELAFSDTGPYSLRALIRAADLEFQQGRTEVARDVYTTVLGRDIPSDESSWARYQIANCALIAGDYGLAKETYEKLVSELPDAYWSGAARERLQSVEWEGDVARRIEELKNP